MNYPKAGGKKIILKKFSFLKKRFSTLHFKSLNEYKKTGTYVAIKGNQAPSH